MFGLLDNILFDDRDLTTHDHGKDFERFVLESLPLMDPTLRPQRSLRLGRDGAIDLYDNESGDSITVIECKFLGQDVTDKPADRWRVVERHLDDNLPTLAADPTKDPNSLYRLWLRKEQPVRGYYFCVTHKMDLSDIANLTGRIQRLFLKLSAVPGLEHLAPLATAPDAVRVLPWDRFHQAVNQSPSLRYRWFGGLPDGLQLLVGSSTNDPKTEKFQDFLREDILPFFSRRLYAQQSSFSAMPTEADLIAGLTAESGPNALILSGPGGVGKTRLALELGRELSGKDWLVVRVRLNATGASIDSLLRSHSKKAHIALLLDYAEAAQHLTNIAEAVRKGAEEGRHHIRLIVTCRGSAQSSVEDALADLTPKVCHLDAPGGVDARNYTTWVARSILAWGELPSIDEILRACDSLPALATFAVYLYRTFPQRFNDQFDALHEIPDFKTWVERRANHLFGTLKPDGNALDLLGDLALSLPLSEERRNAIHSQGGQGRDLLGRLEDDRWVERDGAVWVAAHDVLADGLAAFALIRQAGSATRRVQQALIRAADEHRLATALIATERLTRLPGWTAVDGLEVIRGVGRSHEPALLVEVPRLLRGSLLKLSDKITLPILFPAVQRMVENDRGLDFTLSALAEQAAKDKADPDTRPRFLNSFGVALDRAAAYGHVSNMVIRRAYLLDPDRYRTQALARIGQEPSLSQTHFLLAALLKKGDTAPTLDDAVARWLAACCPHDSKASFVLCSWLGTKRGVNAVASWVLEWLDLHRKTPEARFVLKSWLDAKGEVDAVATWVQEWLSEHSKAPEAQFVLTSWLDAKGDVDAVATWVQEWLDLHAKAPEASFVIPAWLDARGGIDAVATRVQEWLFLHAKTPEASFIIQAWLDAKGGVEVIEEWVQEWLSVHAKTKEADFVMKAWLDAKGGVEVIEQWVQEWLSVHAKTPEASFIIQAWLDAMGGIDAIAPRVLEWLSLNAKTKEADFLMRAWLDTGGAFDAVATAAQEWVHSYAGQEAAVFLTKQLSMQDRIPDQTLADIARWAACFPAHEDAIFRIGRISRSLGAFRNVHVSTRRIVADTGHQVLTQFFANSPLKWGSDPNNTRKAIVILIQNLCRGTVDMLDLRDATRQLTARAIAIGAIFIVDSGLLVTPEVIRVVGKALTAGDLHLERDRVGLDAFSACLVSQELTGELCMVLNALSDLILDHPDPLWTDCRTALRRRLSDPL